MIFHSTSNGAQVLAAAANDPGYLGLVLSGVHGLDNERLDLSCGPFLSLDGPDETSHDRVVVCHSRCPVRRWARCAELHCSSLTSGYVPAILDGRSTTTPRPAWTAIAGRRHTHPREREGAMRTLRAAMTPAKNLGGAA